jgi:hypothetical protein
MTRPGRRRVIAGLGTGALAALAAAGYRRPAPAARPDPLADGPLGSVPTGMTTALAGTGGPVAWEIRDDAARGRVLVQASTDRAAGRCALCILARPRLRDAALAVDAMPITGLAARTAGLVARLRDARNFYVLRADARDGRVVLYKVVDGRPAPLAAGDAPVAPAQWQTLRLQADGPRFAVGFEDRTLFAAVDATFAAGHIGVATWADSVTAFSRLRYAAPA